MPLVKKPRLTEKSLAARRRNGAASRGPVTQAGIEQCAAVNLRHGCYSKNEEAALRSLGEDPNDFLKVLEGLRDAGDDGNPAREKLLGSLARALVRIDRASRQREGQDLKKAREAEEGRETRLHAQMTRLKMTVDALRQLANSVAQEHYVAPPAELDQMVQLHNDDAVGEMSEIALSLIFQLREPGTPGLDEQEEESVAEARKKEVMNSICAAFGLPLRTGNERAPKAGPTADVEESQPVEGTVEAADGASPPEDPAVDERYPEITAEMWDAREPVRQLLENILTRQVEIYEARRQALLSELAAAPSLYERAAEITPSDHDVNLMQRMEDSNLRLASRVMDLLAKLQRLQAKSPGRAKRARSGDLAHKKGG